MTTKPSRKQKILDTLISPEKVARELIPSTIGVCVIECLKANKELSVEALLMTLSADKSKDGEASVRTQVAIDEIKKHIT